jgi:uncharacterized protein YjlB
MENGDIMLLMESCGQQIAEFSSSVDQYIHGKYEKNMRWAIMTRVATKRQKLPIMG